MYLNRRNRIKILAVSVALLGVSNLSAQAPGVVALSLKACVKQVVENNINAVKARIDREKSGYKVNETRSALLPQINIAGSFQDNLKLPTTLINGEALGRPGVMPLEMGVQYNANAAISASQVLYSATALTALQIAKQADETSRLGVEKADETLAREVAKLYFLAQTTAKQKSLIEENITRIQSMTSITEVLLNNGMIKQVDYDRINVTMQNLLTQLDNTDALYAQQLNMLKYMLEIPAHANIVLTDTVNMPLLNMEPLPISDFSSHVDIRLLESQRELARLNYKNVNNGYIPTVSLVGQFAYQGMRTEFKNYFNDSPENKWYNSSYIGVSLSLPVFDGLNKHARSRQAKLEYTKSGLALNNAKEQFDVEYKNAVNAYFNNKRNVERQHQNINLAQKVYEETALKYREGLSTMSDLLQDEMGLNNAQASYLNAIYNFKDAELQIMSLNGNIKNLIN
jgi:outer membrane protein TolC